MAARAVRRSLAVVAAALAIGAHASPARAAPQPAAADEDEIEARETALFRYTRPHERYYLRATLEALGVLGLGYVQYLSNQSGNQVDWDLGYDWDALRAKLTGDAITFDSNHFDTNFVTHPTAGYFYYVAARGNRLNMLASFAYAAAASGVWEFVGELREKASINDLIFTPFSGAAFGEVTTQLGAFFQRGRKNFGNGVLGYLFAPSKAIHDAIDDLEPETADELDALGWPKDVWHRFRFGLGGGATWQRGGDGATHPYADTSAVLTTRIVNLPAYDRAGVHAQGFSEGNVSDLRVATTFSGDHMTDFAFEAHALAAGYYDHRARVGADGTLVGSQSVIGLDVGFEYAQHDFDRERSAALDRIALVTTGPVGEHTAFFGGARLRTKLAVLGSFGGVDAFAFVPYVTSYGTTNMKAVLATEGYYYPFGLTVWPSVTLEADPFDAGVEGRFDAFEEIEGLDRRQAEIRREISAADWRTSVGGWAGATLPGGFLRAVAWAKRTQREGRVEAVHAKQSEMAVGARLELSF